MKSNRFGALRRVASTLVALLLGAGCAIFGVKEQRQAVQNFVAIRGDVRTDVPTPSPLIVVLARVTGAPNDVDPETGRRPAQVIDHFRLDRPGRFAFAAQSGTFRMAAFADRNSNLIYDPGEPVLANRPEFELGAGETLDGIELLIPENVSLDIHFDVLEQQARTPRDQQNFSIGRFTVHGDVVDLDDPKFGRESGETGMWRFVDFLFEIGAGIYFLEPYDPQKIPVLFVHGIAGYPQEFSTLIGKLDRERFQPWFYFYPSGFHLDGISSHLTQVVTDLQLTHGFDQMAVVAHSMGGLVSRSFVLKYWEQTGRRDIESFVAISSPWGGSESASKIENAPQNMMVYSWLDMDPNSDFLQGLFYQPPDFERARPLPQHTRFQMMYGFANDGKGPSGDGRLTMRSMARIEAIEAAGYRALPLPYTHTGILGSAEAVDRLNAILSENFD